MIKGQVCHFHKINSFLSISWLQLPSPCIYLRTRNLLHMGTNLIQPPLFVIEFPISQKTAAMAVQYSRFSIVMFMIILMISQLSSCCEARRCLSKEINQKQSSNSFHFYTKTHQGSSRDEIHPIYGVSLRDVPGGPNPLHN